jgi:DtxR family Mn-dependent transcriptional regulator
MNKPATKSERETLKAIWRLGKDGGAHTGALAEALGVTAGTVTASVKRLADRGLALHQPYRSVELTPAGRRLAVAAIRRHRIVERFLSDMLGYPWNEADRLAPSFEHDLPDEVEERLWVALDRPATCPHGFPIPEPEVAEIPELPPLYDLEPGARAVVALPGSTDPEVVAFLDTLGLRPGVGVEVREKLPFGGPMVLSVEGSDRTVGERVAKQIFVRSGADAVRNVSATPEAVPPRQSGSAGDRQPLGEAGSRPASRKERSA